MGGQTPREEIQLRSHRYPIARAGIPIRRRNRPHREFVELFSFLEDRRVRNVVWLTADAQSREVEIPLPRHNRLLDEDVQRRVA